MSKWIDFSIDERKAMIQGVANAMHIDEPAAEKDWWVTAVLYALFGTEVSEYLLFKGGTSLSKGWNFNEKNSHAPTVPAIRKSISCERKRRTTFWGSLRRI